MSPWRPSLSAFQEALRDPPAWGVDLSGCARGIDNVHIDVELSPQFRETATGIVRRLLAEDVLVQQGESPMQLVGIGELQALRRSYLLLFETLMERRTAAAELVVLLQLALLKWQLLVVAEESRALAEESKRAGQVPQVRDSGRSLALHEQLVTLLRQREAVERRTLQLLLRQVRKLESGPVRKLRDALLAEAWPLPEAALFNPVLLAPSLERAEVLAADYPIAHLAEAGATEWLVQANTCLVEAFSAYLPDYCRRIAHQKAASAEPAPERSDQGLLRGFLSTELLLSGFMSSEEYRNGYTCWLDEPENLRRLLRLPGSAAGGRAVLVPTRWISGDWIAFRGQVRALLHRRLEHWGLGERVVLAYWLPGLRTRLGRALPLSLLADYCSGLLPKRRLEQRLASLGGGPLPADATRLLEGTQAALRRLGPSERGPYLDRFLTDFLTLRRDLKLAYKTHEAMDQIRLLNRPEDTQLSRANGTLYELVTPAEASPTERRILAHAVIKADVRGSTGITDELCARGLNPASHFSLNLFAPVNRLLPEYGAEKLFVEGDAVILAIHEYADGPALTVARACGLARSILRVVALQNAANRRHGLPELELGLGIAFSPREPHFLYDEGRPIMISPAVNTADRLSACTQALRAAEPPGDGQRVLVARRPPLPGAPEELIAYNVNGIRLDQAAFFKLQREVRLRHIRLATDTGGEDLFFVGTYGDARGRTHALAVRCAPILDWGDGRLGARDPQRRHYFEVIADDELSGTLRRRLAEGDGREADITELLPNP